MTPHSRKTRLALICGFSLLILCAAPLPARAFEVNLGGFLTAKKGEGRFLWLLYEHNAERNLWALRPLFSGETGRLSILWPIFATRWDNAAQTRSTRLFPIFWGHDSRGSYFVAFPLFFKMASRHDSSLFILGPVVHNHRGPATLTGLVPFFVSSNPETDSKSVSLFPFYWTRTAGELNTFYILPLYWWKKDRCFSIFPIYGWYQWPDPQRGKWNYVLWPLYMRTQKPTEQKWAILWNLAYRVKGDERRGYAFSPLFGSMTSTDQSETSRHSKSRNYYLFPFIWSLSEEKSRRELNAKDNSYQLLYSRQRRIVFPLFWWGELRKGDLATDEILPTERYESLWLLPLFTRDLYFDGRERMSILWPLYRRSSQNKALKIDILAVFFQYRRNSDQTSHETRLLWRFFAHRSEGDRDFWRIFFSPEFEW